MASRAVFDLDGVLADVRHRLHHLESRPKDWRSFFRQAVSDPVLPAGRQAVERAVAAGLEVTYLTGRPEWCRQDTLDWLQRHGLPGGDLHMRPSRDRRPARFYKAEVLQRLADRGQVEVMYDDDRAVVEHLQSLGLPIVHVTWMEDGEADAVAEHQTDILFHAQEEDGRT